MKVVTPVFDAHRARLTSRFARDLAALDAGSLLDVGCGYGGLLDELIGSVPVLAGVERSESRRAACLERGLAVRPGDADALPFEDESFELVVVRHVLHHLEQPAAAVREACRVARRGVVLAEPSTDASIESQAAMARFDAFTNTLMARAGHVHHAYLDAGAMLALVPWTAPHVETRSYGALTVVPAAEALALIEKAAHGHDLEPAEAARRDELVAAAEKGELTFNGSTAVFVERSGN